MLTDAQVAQTLSNEVLATELARRLDGGELDAESLGSEKAFDIVSTDVFSVILGRRFETLVVAGVDEEGKEVYRIDGSTPMPGDIFQLCYQLQAIAGQVLPSAQDIQIRMDAPDDLRE